MWQHQPDLFFDLGTKTPPNELECWFACASCGTHTDENGICWNCWASHNAFWEIENNESLDNTLSLAGEDIAKKVDKVLSKASFELQIWNDIFRDIRVKTEKWNVRIYFVFGWTKRSVLINPNLDRKIINKTWSYLPKNSFMSIVRFVNHLCNEKDKYNLNRYKAFQ